MMYRKNYAIPILIAPLFLTSAACAFGVTHEFRWMPLPVLARRFALCSVRPGASLCSTEVLHERQQLITADIACTGDRHFAHRLAGCRAASQQDGVQAYRQAHHAHHEDPDRDAIAADYYVRIRSTDFQLNLTLAKLTIKC